MDKRSVSVRGVFRRVGSTHYSGMHRRVWSEEWYEDGDNTGSLGRRWASDSPKDRCSGHKFWEVPSGGDVLWVGEWTNGSTTRGVG